MRMLRRIKGVTLRDRLKSVDIGKELGVSSIQEKITEMRLRWYGHMQRMEENEVRAVGDMRVPGKRPRGRPRGRWMDGVRRDMQTLRITPEDAQDRSTEHSRNQEFRLLTPPSGKRRRRRIKRSFVHPFIHSFVCSFIHIYCNLTQSYQQECRHSLRILYTILAVSQVTLHDIFIYKTMQNVAVFNHEILIDFCKYCCN